jgi:hypothetical protein
MTTEGANLDVPVTTWAEASAPQPPQSPQIVALYDGEGRPVYVPVADVALWLARGLQREPLPDPVAAHDAVQRFGEALQAAARQALDERSPAALAALRVAIDRLSEAIATFDRVMDLAVAQAQAQTHVAAVAAVQLVRRDARGQVVETIHVDPSQEALYRERGYGD